MLYYGCSYSFQISKGIFIAKETRDGQTTKKLELMASTLFEKEVPDNFTTKYSHWWDPVNNTIHFKSRHFDNTKFGEDPKFTLSLNNMTLNENVLARGLISIKSCCFLKITAVLTRIEIPKFIHIWYGMNTEIVEVELVRLGLKFKHENQFLMSHEYPGMRIASNQNLETLVGLKNMIVLEGKKISTAFDSNRQVIIPHGNISIEGDSDKCHQTVRVDLNSLRSPTFFNYEVDSRLQTLKAGKSVAAWFYLAALHGATASPLPDPFTGLTGTEMAFKILQSARCSSSQPFDSESFQTLKFIAAFAPQRAYYPAHLKRMETVNWPNSLPSIAAHDGYALIIKKLTEDSNRLKNLSLSILPNQIEEKERTEHNLRLRHYWRQITFANESAKIFEDFHPDLANTQPSADEIKYGISLPGKDSARTISDLNHKRQFFLESKYTSQIRSLLITSESLSGKSGSNNIAFSNITKWLDMKLRDHWIDLYTFALEVRTEGWESRWTLILSTLAFNREPLEQLLLLQTVALNPEISPPAPSYTRYSCPNGTFDYSSIVSILKNCADSFRDYGYSKLTERNEALHKHNSQTNKSAREYADDIKGQWPTPSYSTNLNKPKITFSNAKSQIDSKLYEWYQNYELDKFISKIESVLGELVSISNFRPIVTDFETHPNSFKQPSLFQVHFKRIMTSFLHTNCNFFQTVEIYSTVLIDEVCDCKTMHPNDINIVQCKESSLKLLEEKRKIILDNLMTVMNPVESEALRASGLYPRLEPLTLLPLLMKQYMDDKWITIQNAIGAIAVIWTLEQRLIRCLNYIDAGESMEVALKRELETKGYENWSPKDHPGWLILELETGMMIRPVQVKVAKEMMNPQSGKNSVMQLNMGEGKTCLIVPMLAIELATVKQLCRVTVLKSIFETNLNSLKHTLGGVLNQRVYTVHCRRDLPIEKEATKVLEILQECKRKRGILVTLPEFRLSFQLKGYENSYHSSKGYDAKYLLKIQKWLDENSRDILDESDEILSVKYQLVYTMGSQKHIGGGNIRWVLSQELLKRIPIRIKDLYEDYGDSGVEFDFGNSSSPEAFTHCRLIQKGCYQELVDKLADDFLEGSMISSFPQLRNEQKKFVRIFLTGYSTLEDGSTFPMISFEHKEALKTLENNHTNLEKVLILAGYLRYEVLLAALGKRWKVNYGVNPNGMRKMAVPFKAKDVASERTEFGHPDMAIILTQLSYYYSGLSDEQLMECFDYLSAKQQKINPVEIYNSWIASISPEKVHDSVKSYAGINLDNYEQMTKHLFPILRKAMIVIDFWLSTFVYPKESKQFPGKMTCTAWDLCSQNQTHLTTGFSGTNDSSDLLPLNIAQNDLEELQGTNKKLEEVLTMEENNIFKSLPPTGSLTKESVKDLTMSEFILSKLKEEGIKVLLDCGALMLEMSNEQVALKWLQIDTSLEAVIYFNKANLLTVKLRDGAKDCSLELSPFRTRLDTCAVYLDDEHTRGTDLKFPRGSKACVTIGSGLTRDKLAQACMRMRLLGNGHTVSFWASHEAHTKIKDLTKCDEVCSSKDVLEWVKHNSKEFVENGLVYWTASAVNYCRKLAAERHILLLDQSNLQKLGEMCTEDEVTELIEMYGRMREEDRFVNIIPSWFRSLRKILIKKSQGATLSPDLETLFEQIETSVLARCKILIPEKVHYCQLLEEEQEKELENELEEEKEPDPPRKASPMEHILHPSVKTALIIGDIQPCILAGTIELLPQAFQNTKLWDNCDIQPNCWGDQIYVTSDFKNVIIRGNIHENLDEFLRHPAWVVSLKRNKNQVFLLISPYEANEMIKSFRNDKTMKSVLHLYASRLLAGQKYTLIDKQELCLPLVDVRLSEELMAPLSLFAGTLYFSGVAEEQAFADFLGIIPRQGRTKEQKKAFNDNKIVENGFVDPKYRLELIGKVRPNGFMKNPDTLVKEILRTRNQGNIPEGSHVKKLALDGMRSFGQE